jgi:DNA-binding XRE family transcriptional regulator
MATRTSPTHVLRTTRKRYGYSQQKLATLIGCSLAAIKAIETGKLRPSPDLAHRVYMMTGLDPQQLIKNIAPKDPRDPFNVPLTEEMIKLRRRDPHVLRRRDPHDPDPRFRSQIEGNIRLYTAVLGVLLDVSDHKLWALRPALESAINKLIRDFGLEREFRRALRARYGVKGPWTAAVILSKHPSDGQSLQYGASA